MRLSARFLARTASSFAARQEGRITSCWIQDHPGGEAEDVIMEFRQWATAFPLAKVDWFELTLDFRGVIEGGTRCFQGQALRLEDAR